MFRRRQNDADREQNNSRALATDHLLTGLGTRSANGIAVSTAAQAAGFIIQLANAAAMARLLAPGDFGVAALAMSVTGLVGIFTDLGLSAATVQRRDLDQDTVSVLFAVNLLAGLAGMIVCFGLAAPAAWVYNDDRVFWAISGFACVVPISALAVQHNALLSRGMRWWSIQSIGLASGTAGVVAGIIFAVFDAGYWALIAAGAATALTRLILLWLACPWRPSWVREWASARSAVNFGAHMTGFNLTLFLARQADVMLIGWFWGATQTGFYTRAYQLMLLPLNTISGPLGGVFIPALSRLQSEPTRWRDAFMSAYLVSAVIGCAFASVLIVCADQIVYLIYGPNWEQTISIFRWLSWSMICTFPMGAMAWAFVSLGNSKAMFHWGLLSLIVLAIVFALAVPFGPLGVAKAYTVAIWVLTPACFHLALRTSPISTGKALIEIAPLWIGALVAATVGLQTKSSTGIGLVADLILESIVTVLVFSLVVVVLAYRRREYQRMAASARELLAALIKRRPRETLR